jgi:hypothetical protein
MSPRQCRQQHHGHRFRIQDGQTLFDLVKIDHNVIRFADTACDEECSLHPFMLTLGDIKAGSGAEVIKRRINILPLGQPFNDFRRCGADARIGDGDNRTILGFDTIARPDFS